MGFSSPSKEPAGKEYIVRMRMEDGITGPWQRNLYPVFKWLYLGDGSSFMVAVFRFQMFSRLVSKTES